MKEDSKTVSANIQVGDPTREPTDDNLKEDAGSLCSQYLHFWNPGEVEVTVILSRPGSKEVVYGTSIMSHERLLKSLEAVKKESAIQKVLIKDHKVQS